MFGCAVIHVRVRARLRVTVEPDTSGVVRVVDPIERSAPVTGCSRSTSYQVDHAYGPSATVQLYNEAVQRLVRT